MPKQKKQPRNSCYFFMAERKRDLESSGHRFPGGMQDVFHACGPEWKALSKEERSKYEEMAKQEKEKEKFNLHNKFTVAGESYAQVNDRILREQKKAAELDKFIGDLACDDSNGRRPQDRNYILIKCLHSVEESKPDGKKYWPAEISLAAFSLSFGLRSVWWTLVDIEKPPLGYASSAKDSSDEYGLPIPGSEEFQEEHRDYDKIVKNIVEFIKNILSDYKSNGEQYAVFCLPGEIEPARQSVFWLMQNMKSETKQQEYLEFWSDLEFCDLSKLMVKMALYGKKINPGYRSQLADLKLEATARDILKIGSHDYKSQITCIHHRQGDASQKMNWCCKNVVLRRMFLMFEEFINQYGLEKEKNKRHDIEQMPKPNPTAPATKRGATSSFNSSKNSYDDWDRKTGSGSFYGGDGPVKKKCESESDMTDSTSEGFLPGRWT